MLISILILFLSLALVLTIIGFYFNISLMTIGGTTIIFLMGMSLINEPLTYQTGDNISMYYGNNLTNAWDNNGGSVPSSSDVYIFTTTTTATYSSWSDTNTHTLAFIIMSVGALGLVLSMFYLRGRE